MEMWWYDLRRGCESSSSRYSTPFAPCAPSCVINADGATPSVRVALQVQYNGADFHGWERKPDVRTVQGELNAALADVVGISVPTFAASRTDAGTHAIAQVVHFDAPRLFSSATSYCRALNSRLPETVRITRAAEARTDFHSRHSAVTRSYRYTLLTAPQPSVFVSPFVWHVYRDPLDTARMARAAETLVTGSGHTIDLSAFRKRGAAARHTRISVQRVAVVVEGSYVHVDVCASWFVYGMMRLLVASLVRVGLQLLSVDEFKRIVVDGDRACVPSSAPPNGLCLVGVDYGPLQPFHGDLTLPVHKCYEL